MAGEEQLRRASKALKAARDTIDRHERTLAYKSARLGWLEGLVIALIGEPLAAKNQEMLKQISDFLVKAGMTTDPASGLKAFLDFIECIEKVRESDAEDLASESLEDVLAQQPDGDETNSDQGSEDEGGGKQPE